MNQNLPEFRKDFLKDWERHSEHGIDSCHNYFGMSENQYLLTEEDAQLFLQLLKKDYYLLKLKKHESHKYDNVYMDTQDLDLYKNKKKRDYNFSVRTRAYHNHEIVYFQVKYIKNGRSTIYSYEYKNPETNQLTTEMWNYYCGIYESLVGKQPKKLIFPAVQVSYDRYILYNKHTDERVDIDYNITFTNLRDDKNPTYTLENIVMIESKSSVKETKIADILKKMNAKQSNTGLYPLALHYVNYSAKDKNIEKTVKRILKLQKKK